MGVLFINKTKPSVDKGLGKIDLTTGALITGGTPAASAKGRFLFDMSYFDSATPAGATGAGQNTDGLWWNNVFENIIGGTYPATFFTSGVNTTNQSANISLSVDRAPANGMEGTNMNGAGVNVQVGDYPATATKDSLYMVPGIVVNFTFTFPAGTTGAVKFWGSRGVTDDTRHLQLKKSTDTIWLEYNAANNTNFNEAVTFTGLTGTVIIQAQVKAGSTFGYISLLDITLS